MPDLFCSECGGKMYTWTSGMVGAGEHDRWRTCGACHRRVQLPLESPNPALETVRERVRLAALTGDSMILSGTEAKLVLSLINRG